MPQSAPLPRFLVTAELSRLARWLRVLGFDTVIAASGKPTDWVRICALQDRILLTRIKKPEKLKGVKTCLFIESDSHASQLKQVVSTLTLHTFCIFSRCLDCNRRVFPIAKEKILNRLPKKVQEKAERFTCCRKCGKIFWKGTHFEAMLQFLSREIDGLTPENIGEFVLTDFC